MPFIYFMTLIYFVFAILGSPAHWPINEKARPLLELFILIKKYFFYIVISELLKNIKNILN
jgi:hypothetical protein